MGAFKKRKMREGKYSGQPASSSAKVSYVGAGATPFAPTIVSIPGFDEWANSYLRRLREQYALPEVLASPRIRIADELD